MSCTGSKEVGVRGIGSCSYVGYRLGISSILANISARIDAWNDLRQKIAAEKGAICAGLCAKGCECLTTDFPNPTAYNNPQVSWSATSTGWLGISLAGSYTTTYAYIVKAECKDPTSAS